MPHNALIYFVKYPEPGKVKTRLAREVGDEQAAEIYRNLVESNLKILGHVSESFRLILAFDPPDKEKEVKAWLEPLKIDVFLPQAGAALGERLENAFDVAFSEKAKRVMALGSDTLQLTPEIISEGFESLKEKDCVIGPARDGGYYLIGLASSIPGIFENIPWSTSLVCQNTIQYLTHWEWDYHLLPRLEDLDEAKNLKACLPAGREE